MLRRLHFRSSDRSLRTSLPTPDLPSQLVKNGLQLTLQSDTSSHWQEPEKEWDKKIAEDSQEFFMARNLDKAGVYFSTLPAVHHRCLVEKLVGTAMKGVEADAQLVADLLVRAVSERLCSVKALEEGFNPLLRNMAIKAPKAASNMALMMRAASIMSQGTKISTMTRSEIWYEDGSVVLQAQNTQFRVYWGVLTHQSSFFRGMQGLPQPPDQPTVDSCPVIELQDDVADVEYMLKALFIPTFLAQDALPVMAVRALLRLGRKYDLQDVLESVVSRLVFENPRTLQEYDALLLPGKTYKTSRIEFYPGVLIDILTLARENDLLSILPCAYYRILVYYTPKQFFEGVPRGDGTTAFLAPEDLRRCTLGRDELLRARFKEGYSLGWLEKWNYDSDCADRAKCTQARLSQLHYYTTFTPLWILKRSVQDQKTLCPACYRHSGESTVAGREKLWEDIPKFFDLPPWSELKNDL